MRSGSVSNGLILMVSSYYIFSLVGFLFLDVLVDDRFTSYDCVLMLILVFLYLNVNLPLINCSEIEIILFQQLC